MLSLRMPHILFDLLTTRLSDAFSKIHRAALAPLNPYRPERHYMRGAGPATYAKRRRQTYFETHSRSPGAVR
jgi:hypothetical protein